MKKRPNLGKPIPSSEITPKDVYLSRRQFMKAAGIAAAGALLAACTPQETPEPLPSETDAPPTAQYSDELMDPATSFDAITNYNNYYEFTVDKERVARLAKDFTTTPWQVEIGGLVNKPRTFSLEDILALGTEEERVYRMRCVEGWSMVIPWLGFPLSKLLEMVEPTVDAKYVYFETAVDEETMPVIKRGLFQFPYTEGLRLDEAMHDLTILSTGLYGERLMPQNGAPIRLVVPWKYGFKSIKSIVKIKLVDRQPYTFWNNYAPQEYGFYSNVNPDVPHPRWSQATEVIIGHGPKRVPTLMFNGYEEEVASMYAGMDLTKFF